MAITKAKMKALFKLTLISVTTLLVVIQVFAEGAVADSNATNEALAKTQSLLKDPKQREKAGLESPKAAATMKSTETFVGKENTDELYDLSSEIFGTITTRSNGDVKKMKEDLSATPETFVQFLTPAEISRIEALAKKIESQRGPSSTTKSPD